MVPSPGDPTGVLEVLQGRGHVERRVHPRRDAARQGNLPWDFYSEPGGIDR
jgi:hypothetical protein